MTSTPFSKKRLNLEIIFWDLTILLITLARDLLRAMPSRLPIDKQLLSKLVFWFLWGLAGLSTGWLLGIAAH